MMVAWNCEAGRPEDCHKITYSPANDDEREFFAGYDRDREDAFESTDLPPALKLIDAEMGAALMGVDYDQDLDRRYRSMQFYIDSSLFTLEGAQSHVDNAVAQAYAYNSR